MAVIDVDPAHADHRAEPVGRPLAVLAILVVAADALLFHTAPGISVPLYALVVFAGCCVANVQALRWRSVTIALFVLAATLAPSVESAGTLSLAFAVLGAALAVRIATGRVIGDAWRETVATLWTALAGPLQALLDALWIQAALRRSRGIRLKAAALAAWCLPVGFGIVFLLIFSAANPIITQIFLHATARLSALINDVDSGRVFLWLAVAAACWSFVFVGRYEPKRTTQPAPRPSPAADAPTNPLLGRAAILRSLIVFNLLFALQTGMDLVYLWGRAELPAGVTYAAYAHRGAYALLIAALISAGFMLATMRPGSVMERSRLIRGLAFLWTGQNVLLVVSAMLRVDLYVEVYSLTYLRVAAMIWMLLVAVGLVLILCRILFRRSLGWLVWGNALSLAVALYACSFVNFSDVIARYNIAHSREMGGPGRLLDQGHICSLGPNALPAIRDFIAAQDRAPPAAVWRDLSLLRFCAGELETRYAGQPRDWRSWTLRSSWLARQLATGPDSAA